ncbi:MAG: hypothetical protein U5L10_01890 [Candidatus Moranbacteria bacterium]|nr:hypothetical protein [Candidatus Moranbacteria bacterium]
MAGDNQGGEKNKKNRRNQLSLTPGVVGLFETAYAQHKEKQSKSGDNEPKIKVSTAISKLSFYYEKIRNAVDYKDEYLLRKTAIERILKRQIIIESVLQPAKSSKIAQHLMIELIRGEYLANNSVPEKKIDEVAKVVQKYIKLHNKAIRGSLASKRNKELSDWIIALMASEIEEELGRDKVVEKAISFMFQVLRDKVILPDDADYNQNKDIQIYVSIYRTFLKFDTDMVSFILFKSAVDSWKNAGEETIEKTARELDSIRATIENQVNSPISNKLKRVISRYTVFFEILTEVIKKDPVKAYSKASRDPDSFREMIRESCRKKYETVRAKIWRASFRSIVYIFITKSLLVFALEIPVINLLGESVNYISLAVNIGFPPLLLFSIIMTTKTPTSRNTQKIIEGIEGLVHPGKEVQAYRLRTSALRGKTLNTVFGIIYLGTFLITFGGIVWILNMIGFHFVSIVIFLFFLALVSFFSARIRKKAHELMVVEPKESIFRLFTDFFYTPVLAAGKWLSENFSKLNVFVIVLDFIIEAPFKFFVEATEEWSKYVKERREEIE